jgi:hypothetical protein
LVEWPPSTILPGGLPPRGDLGSRGLASSDSARHGAVVRHAAAARIRTHS